MQTTSLWKQSLVLGMIIVFGTNVIPIAAGLPIETHTSMIRSVKELNTIMNTDPRGFHINLSGKMGNNGWYVSGVLISIIDDNGSTPMHFYYKFQNGDPWTEYTGGELGIYLDGIYNFSALVIDQYGNQWYLGPVQIKIDQTPPTIISLIAEKTGRDKYRIYADVFDATSGVDIVEFYQNDYLIHTDDMAPYEWLYKGPSFKLDAIVYDEAGNSVMAMTSPDLNSYFAIGFIENPQIGVYGATFYAIFVIFFGHYFPFLYHVSTLINQQFAVPNYTGKINEHFILIKYHGVY